MQSLCDLLVDPDLPFGQPWLHYYILYSTARAALRQRLSYKAPRPARRASLSRSSVAAGASTFLDRQLNRATHSPLNVKSCAPSHLDSI